MSIFPAQEFFDDFYNFFSKVWRICHLAPIAVVPPPGNRPVFSKTERIMSKQWEFSLYLHILCVFFLSSAVFFLCYNVS